MFGDVIANLFVVSSPDHYEAVLAREYLVGNNRRVRGAVSAALLAGNQVIRGNVCKPRELPSNTCLSAVWRYKGTGTYLGLKQVTVYPNPFSCLRPRQQTSHDGTMRIQARCDVCRGYTDLARGTVWLPSAMLPQLLANAGEKGHPHVHKTSFRFNNHIVTSGLSVWPSLTVS